MKYFLLLLKKEASLGKEQDDKDSHTLQIRVACVGVRAYSVGQGCSEEVQKNNLNYTFPAAFLTQKSLKRNNRKGDLPLASSAGTRLGNWAPAGIVTVSSFEQKRWVMSLPQPEQLHCLWPPALATYSPKGNNLQDLKTEKN